MPLQVRATVIENRPYGAGYARLVLDAREIARHTRPGQFVNLRLLGAGAPYLRRPFSVFGAHAEGNSADALGPLSLLYKVVGIGTRALAALPAGAPVDLLGPLGNAFPEPTGDAPVHLIGGGFGLAPLGFFARVARAKEHAAGTHRAWRLFAGARTRAELPYLAELTRYVGDLPIAVSTEDGSAGERGLVTEALTRALDGITTTPGSVSARPVLYACGPQGMLRAVARLAAARGLTCFVSLEALMACGFGVCHSCVCRLRTKPAHAAPQSAADLTREPSAPYTPGAFRWARICVQGTVFDARRLAWD